MNNDAKKPQNPEEEQKKQELRLMVFGLATEFGFIIAVPLIVLLWLGKWLDQRYHYHNLFLLIGLFLALATSTIYIGKKINEIRKRLK